MQSDLVYVVHTIEASVWGPYQVALFVLSMPRPPSIAASLIIHHHYCPNFVLGLQCESSHTAGIWGLGVQHQDWQHRSEQLHL